VSPVHILNAELLAERLQDATFEIIVEDDAPWFAGVSFEAEKLTIHRLTDVDFNELLGKGGYSVLICSTLQPRATPLKLVQVARQYGIPVVAIEESNQVSLNSGRVNNYPLPCDLILVASEAEREGFESQGVTLAHVRAIGWPFYRGKRRPASSKEKEEARRRLGCPAGKRAVSLTLTGMGEAGESPEVRQRQVDMALAGLPEDTVLFIKPHPTEPLEKVTRFLPEGNNSVIAIEGKIPVQVLLDASDVLLNRGVSQVCFEAALQGVPTLVLDTSIKTIFHRDYPEIVVRTADELRSLIEKNLDGSVMEKILAEHCRVDGVLDEIAIILEDRVLLQQLRNERKREKDLMLLAIQAWLGEEVQAPEGNGVAEEAMARLIKARGRREDVELLSGVFGRGFYRSIFQALWVRQLEATRVGPDQDDVRMLRDFPPSVRPIWFEASLRTWMTLLYRVGFPEAIEEVVDRLESDPVYGFNFRELCDQGKKLMRKTGWTSRLKNRFFWEHPSQIEKAIKD